MDLPSALVHSLTLSEAAYLTPKSEKKSLELRTKNQDLLPLRYVYAVTHLTWINWYGLPPGQVRSPRRSDLADGPSFATLSV